MIFNHMSPDTIFSTMNSLQVQNIGNMIYTHGAVWIIVASIILLLAIVAPISLSMNKNRTVPKHP